MTTPYIPPGFGKGGAPRRVATLPRYEGSTEQESYVLPEREKEERPSPYAKIPFLRLLTGRAEDTGMAPNRRRARYAEEVPAWMDSTFMSPAADTAFAATGGRPFRLGAFDGGDGLEGQEVTHGLFTQSMLNPDYRLLGMNKSKNAYDDPEYYRDSPYTRDNVLKHELGHAYAVDNFAKFPTALFRYPSDFPTKEDEANRYRMIVDDMDKTSLSAGMSLMERARANLDEYGATGPSEAFASAFKNAINWLSESARTGDTQDMRQRLAELEGQTPGVGTIANRLLKTRDIYAKHPLRQSYGWDVR